MVVARSTAETFPFVLPAEREAPPEQRTTFTLRRLSNNAMLRLVELVTENHTRLAHTLAVRAGVAGWENLRDAAGVSIPCDRQNGKAAIAGIDVERPLTEACFDMLPFEALAELTKAVLNGNTLTVDDAKN